MAIVLPNNWSARPYQRSLFDYMFDGGLDSKRAVEVLHRRAGKDSTAINLTAVATQMRVGTYWHMLPTLNQGRKVIWKGIDKFGRRIIDQAFPKGMRAKAPNESEMTIEMKNGSIWQVVGSDNFDSLVGTNPVGVIMSEYSVADPRAWDFIRPILLENKGWAVFIYTSRGRNHGYDLYEMALNNPKWFCDMRTVEQTTDDDGNRIVTDQDIQDERDSGMSEEMIAQEYYCSFDSGLFGAYYTSQLTMLQNKGRIGDFPWNPRKPVHTFWDLGLRDANAIWFAQDGQGDSINVIDYMEDNNVPMIEWIKRIQELPYTYGTHNGPHDIEHREYTTGVSRIDVATDLGIYFDVAPKIPVHEGIDTVKSILPRCNFDKNNCARGIDALYNYQREWNDKAKIFLDRPLHNWASHGADAFRNLGIMYPEGNALEVIKQFKVKRAIGGRRG